ncbi:MAG: phosphoribosylanthranilate isomerase [Bacteroidota bacterium]|nr:phosphoribosylanthranilate isomerase [Bacteroidota bacterium]MDP4217344.1 phosphoribosylanthranilate isomerase [Bacteroidota bacterium]MDP4245773.1 phosphoribosylanthranilate isomerase [Bacteroidota bacterium]MDP4253570.1 phosphoribosylanthranilate isomerase [Bacteroidota bacterium]MDP4257083.1 phosphoribosylanthranilate isomerase [Bacteroidota bacterium]
MTEIEQLRQLDAMGVDFAGFIFYPKSPRYVVRHLSGEELKKARLRLGKVGVFVNAQYDEVMRQVDSYGLDMIQLHGDETPRFCEQLANYITVIKVFRLGDNDPIDWIVRPYQDSCDMLMFDTEGAGYGGTGKKFNWDLLKPARIDKLYFLSGGIEPGDAEKLRSFAREPAAAKLFSIDINSKFEVTAGVKDLKKIRSMIDELKRNQ